MIRKPVQLDPPMITIRGPVDEVKAVSEVFTDDIAIDGIAPGSHTRRVQLEPLPGHVTCATEAMAQVTLEIVPELGDRVLRKLDVAVVGGGEAKLRPATVSVALRGPVRWGVDVEASEIVPYVDLVTQAPTPGFVPVAVQVRGVPAGFEVVRIMPATVLVQRKL
jgi:YbbR domain-containing protein